MPWEWQGTIYKVRGIKSQFPYDVFWDIGDEWDGEAWGVSICDVGGLKTSETLDHNEHPSLISSTTGYWDKLWLGKKKFSFIM